MTCSRCSPSGDGPRLVLHRLLGADQHQRLGLTALAVLDFHAYLRRSDFAAYDETFAELLAPGISILMPAYNEAAGIVEAVRAMTAMRYPTSRSWSSTTGRATTRSGSWWRRSTWWRRRSWCLPHPHLGPGAAHVPEPASHNVLLVRKENGKADALNVGINAARKALVCMVDATPS